MYSFIFIEKGVRHTKLIGSFFKYFDENDTDIIKLDDNTYLVKKKYSLNNSFSLNKNLENKVFIIF